jgi:hypothetical protein
MLATNPSALRVRRTSDISALALPCSTEMTHALVTPTASANWAWVQPSVFRRVRMDAPISREVRACTMSSYVDIGRVSTFVVISQCQRSRSSQRAVMAIPPSGLCRHVFGKCWIGMRVWRVSLKQPVRIGRIAQRNLRAGGLDGYGLGSGRAIC